MSVIGPRPQLVRDISFFFSLRESSSDPPWDWISLTVQVVPSERNIHGVATKKCINVDIGRFMKCLSERYAMYFNHKYQYRGHLFESRYGGVTI